MPRDEAVAALRALFKDVPLLVAEDPRPCIQRFLNWDASTDATKKAAWVGGEEGGLGGGHDMAGALHLDDFGRQLAMQAVGATVAACGEGPEPKLVIRTTSSGLFPGMTYARKWQCPP